MAEVDILEAEQQARAEDTRAAEMDLIERLAAHGYAGLWDKVRDGLHCQRFLGSRTGKRVYERLARTVADAQSEWLNAADPRAANITEAHRRAQAAHFAIFALDEILRDGGDAERELNQIERELGE